MTTLSCNSVTWAIEHLFRYSDTDIFPKIFEYEAIKYSQDEIINTISKQDICQWTTHPLRKCFVPKQRYGFRIATQLDPLDMVFFLALCLEISESIEKSRLPIERKVSFSNRFKRDDVNFLFFDKNFGYSDFQEYCSELAQKCNFVVVTDIADFYSRMYLHRIENALEVSAKTLPIHAKAVVKLIKGWNQGISYGIPIGNNPSRLIAEIVMDGIDRTLFGEDIIFTRYNDDFRIFCNSRPEAYQCLVRLADVLYETQGLTLQTQKTKIMTSKQK